MPSLQPNAAMELDGDERRYRSADAEIGRLLAVAALVIIVLFGGICGWAAISSITGAVIAVGNVTVQTKRKVVQHLDGGIVARVHVADGDLVTAGALLVSLDGRELADELSGAEAEVAARLAQAKLVAAELQGLKELHAKRLVPRTRLTALEREASSISADIARLKSRKSKVAARLGRIQIRAPVSGRVHQLTTNTVGGVIAPNATIAEIVPSGDGLVIEARLAPHDVDQVHVGRPAKVRMTSLNQRTTPMLNAAVKRVSADTVQDSAEQPAYFRVTIGLMEGELAKLKGIQLAPGMPAEVLIETNKRSVLSYLTKPLQDQFARAFLEE